MTSILKECNSLPFTAPTDKQQKAFRKAALSTLKLGEAVPKIESPFQSISEFFEALETIKRFQQAHAFFEQIPQDGVCDLQDNSSKLSPNDIKIYSSILRIEDLTNQIKSSKEHTESKKATIQLVIEVSQLILLMFENESLRFPYPLMAISNLSCLKLAENLAISETAQDTSDDSWDSV